MSGQFDQDQNQFGEGFQEYTSAQNEQQANQNNQYKQQPVSINQTSNVGNFEEAFNSVSYEPEEVTAEMIQMRKKDSEIQQKLRQKADKQRTLKDQRKEKGKQELLKFKNDWNTQVETKRTQNRAKQQQNPKQSSNISNPWQKVVKNIALKEGERVGDKNINRMKQALVRKSKDSRI